MKKIIFQIIKEQAITIIGAIASIIILLKIGRIVPKSESVFRVSIKQSTEIN